MQSEDGAPQVRLRRKYLERDGISHLRNAIRLCSSSEVLWSGLPAMRASTLELVVVISSSSCPILRGMRRTFFIMAWRTVASDETSTALKEVGTMFKYGKKGRKK